MNLKGLTTKEAEQSRQKHGSNVLTDIPSDPLWKKILEGFKDPMIMILLVALVVQVVLFSFIRQNGSSLREFSWRFLLQTAFRP